MPLFFVLGRVCCDFDLFQQVGVLHVLQAIFIAEIIEILLLPFTYSASVRGVGFLVCLPARGSRSCSKALTHLTPLG